MLGVSRTIYVNVDSPNLSFPYFNFLGGYQWKKNTLYVPTPYIAAEIVKGFELSALTAKQSQFQT